MNSSLPYVGRFAPSPSGPLHFGSLVAAVASYLDARKHNGKWLLRIEDIDEPRSVEGADNAIMHSLKAHHLNWDEQVSYQSDQHARYQAIIDTLVEEENAYYCQCTRKMIRQTGGIYQGTCRHKQHPATGSAVRLYNDNPVNYFEDRIQGEVRINDAHALEDTVLKRRDGFFSYNLVVVLDDIAQGVTHIVRGSDLLNTTAAHLTLYQRLHRPPPKYAHFPVVATHPGFKLSKQNHANAINDLTPQENLRKALKFLTLWKPECDNINSCKSLLEWATIQWDCKKLPKKTEIIVDQDNCPYYYEP